MSEVPFEASTAHLMPPAARLLDDTNGVSMGEVDSRPDDVSHHGGSPPADTVGSGGGGPGVALDDRVTPDVPHGLNGYGTASGSGTSRDRKRARISNRLELPDEIDAELYGLRRSVSPPDQMSRRSPARLY